MTIQINTDKNLEGNERFNEYFTTLIKDELHRYENITRVEIHLSDENGNKEGNGDKKCLLEARLEGKQPIAVNHFANTPEQAVTGAIDKLKMSIDKIIGKARNY